MIGGLNLFAYAKSNPVLYVDPFGREAAKTCCKGGQVDVCVVQNLIEPAMQCVIEHEKQHVQDIKKWMPCNQCSNRPDGSNIGGDQDLADWGAQPEAAAAMECAGYRREYECLKKNRNLAPNPGMVDRRLDQIKAFLGSNYPTCFAGQTWK